MPIQPCGQPALSYWPLNRAFATMRFMASWLWHGRDTTKNHAIKSFTPQARGIDALVLSNTYKLFFAGNSRIMDLNASCAKSTSISSTLSPLIL